jgi:hypothetical protein
MRALLASSVIKLGLRLEIGPAAGHFNFEDDSKFNVCQLFRISGQNLPVRNPPILAIPMRRPSALFSALFAANKAFNLRMAAISCNSGA